MNTLLLIIIKFSRGRFTTATKAWSRWSRYTGRTRRLGAAIVSDVLGKPFSYAAVTKEQFRASMTQAGLPDLIVEVLAELKTNFVDGRFDILTTDVERLSGRKPKSPRDVFAARFA